MWKVINKATNRKPKPDVIPDFIESRTTDGGVIKTRCKTDIANQMNKQNLNLE